jgi:hypothetical protein
MHAILLALLLSQEVNNSYGKLSACADAWLDGIGGLSLRTRAA